MSRIDVCAVAHACMCVQFYNSLLCACVFTFQFPALHFMLYWMPYRWISTKNTHAFTHTHNDDAIRDENRRMQNENGMKKTGSRKESSHRAYWKLCCVCALENLHIRSVAYLWRALFLPGARTRLASLLALCLSLTDAHNTRSQRQIHARKNRRKE